MCVSIFERSMTQKWLWTSEYSHNKNNPRNYILQENFQM